MATYLVLNLVFMAAVLGILWRINALRWNKLMTSLLVLLLVLTAVFDSMIVGLGIVDYDTTKLLGIYIGNAPIEDFFYAVLVVMVVPMVWDKLGEYSDRKS